MRITNTKTLATLVAQAGKIREKLRDKSDEYVEETGDGEWNKYDSMAVFFEQAEIALDELKEEIENIDWELPNGN